MTNPTHDPALEQEALAAVDNLLTDCDCGACLGTLYVAGALAERERWMERQLHEGPHVCDNVKIVDQLRSEVERLKENK